MAQFGTHSACVCVLASLLWGKSLSAKYSWLQLYEQAIVETDSVRLPALIQAAQAALDLRIQELQQQSDHFEESHAISDALAGLRMLQQELTPNKT